MRAVPVADILDANQVLAALFAFKKGDFSVRLPVNQVGLAGKIADVLNDIFELNENMANELARVSTAVGKERRIGKLDGVHGVGQQPDLGSGAAFHRDRPRYRSGGAGRSLSENVARSGGP